MRARLLSANQLLRCSAVNRAGVRLRLLLRLAAAAVLISVKCPPYGGGRRCGRMDTAGWLALFAPLGHQTTTSITVPLLLLAAPRRILSHTHTHTQTIKLGVLRLLLRLCELNETARRCVLCVVGVVELAVVVVVLRRVRAVLSERSEVSSLVAEGLLLPNSRLLGVRPFQSASNRSACQLAGPSLRVAGRKRTLARPASLTRPDTRQLGWPRLSHCNLLLLLAVLVVVLLLVVLLQLSTCLPVRPTIVAANEPSET